MPTAISTSAVVVPALAPLPVRLAPGAGGALTLDRTASRRRIRRLFSALGDIGEVFVIAYAFPVAILAIGIPVALLVRLAARLAGAL